MDDFKKFINQYKGAIIGVIIAIVLLATRLYDVIIGILIILAGAFVGNYVQQNKDDVKAKLKKFIDRMQFIKCNVKIIHRQNVVYKMQY